MPRTLPEFDIPPVAETVLGVEFAQLPKFGAAHYGLYWATIKDRFPTHQVVPALDTFADEKPSRKGISLQLLSHPPFRCWFINREQTDLIQVQNDKFLYNWRKVVGSEAYPRFDEYTKPAFEREWNGFTEFLANNQLGVPLIRRFEITYVNHLEKGREWNDLRDVSRITRFLSVPQGTLLQVPQAIESSVQYKFDRGTLRIVLQPAIRHADGKEIMQLSLTARVKPVGDGTSEVGDSLSLGREWIVKGFTEFTTSEMHSIWRRRA